MTEPRRSTEGEFSSLHVILAWGAHAFTASGAVVGALALLSIAAGELARAALLMMLALGIDALDGLWARAVGVGEVLPAVDGRRLDDIVDYLNYTIVPCVFMVEAHSLPGVGWIVFPVLASAYGFSQVAAKTEDDFFLGFPSYWNGLALYLWLLAIPPAIGALLASAFAIGVFVPIRYLYPSKMRVLRSGTIAGTVLWWWLLVGAIAFPKLRTLLTLLSLVYPAYYFGASFWIGGLERRGV